MKYKRQIQLYLALFVLFISALFTAYYIHHEEVYLGEINHNSSENVKRMYDLVVDDVDRFYTYRAYANLRSKGVKEAMLARDTQTLYKLILPRYKTLREENPFLTVMQFHTPDGKSLLRMHRKEAYGDSIASHRPMIHKVHQLHTIQKGFEGGLEGVAYRIVVPYIENNVYIGALEFGIDPDYMMDKLTHSSKMDTLFMIHDSRLAAANIQKYPISVGGYHFTHLSPNQLPLVESFIKDNPGLNNHVIAMDEKEYDVFHIHLVGNDKNPAGILLCFNDITNANQELLQIMLESLALTLLIIVVLMGILEVIFKKIVKHITFQDEYVTTILNAQKNLIVVTDGRNIIYANNAFFDYLHYRTLEDFRKDYDCICDLFESTETENYLLPDIDGMRWTEYILAYNDREHKAKITVDGKVSTFVVSAKMMDYANQLRCVVVFSDITKLNELATLDSLTKIPNRFEFDKILEHSLSVSRRYNRPLSILLLDIDNFKLINDKYGHLIGDDVLKAFSALLCVQIRDSDVVARWGGEEFMILLPDTPLASAIKMAEALRQRIEVHIFQTVTSVTCSIGVAEFNPVEEADDLFHRADEKLYAAKNGGRNRVMA